jgi:hypothetical protein
LVPVLILMLIGCSTQADPLSSGELQAQADLAAARETRIAQSTRDALAVVAKATSDALALEEQATSQAVSLAETQQAATLEATRRAWAYQATVEAVQTTSTAVAIRATQNAESVRATATAEAVRAQATALAQAGQATAVEATSQAIQRQGEREQARQLLTTFGGWALVILCLAALVLLCAYLAPVMKARLQVVRRKQGEIEPLVVTLERIVMPSRLFSPLLNVNGEYSPQLTPPEWQDRASGRAQLVDVVAAARGSGKRQVVRRPAPQARDGDQWKLEHCPGLDSTGQHAPMWPTRVPLSGILDGPPSVRDLVLGVTVREDGQREIVKADMGDLVHVAVGGSSGWGKSVFLRALAFQLARSVDPVDLALVDLEGATFAPFAECGRLLWPVADTEQDALAIFKALTEEMDRRKALYSGFPGVDSLQTYNARVEEPLAPVVALVDEATALLAHSGVENAIRTLVLRARKYGLWCVLGGQDWKASSLDTSIRNQLASRVQFKALSASQSRVLLQRSGAERLEVPGRALAILPGRDIVELQAPVIGYRDIIRATRSGGPRRDLPEVDQEGNEQMARIRELADQGLSKRQIALEVFGYAGGAAYTAVTGALSLSDPESFGHRTKGRTRALQSCTTTTATAVQAESIA